MQLILWTNEGDHSTCEYQSARFSSFFASRPRRVCFFSPLWLSSLWTYRNTAYIHSDWAYEKRWNIRRYFNNLQLSQVASLLKSPFLSCWESCHLLLGSQYQSASWTVLSTATAALLLHLQQSDKTSLFTDRCSGSHGRSVNIVTRLWDGQTGFIPQ